jgi:hypothetical protein
MPIAQRVTVHDLKSEPEKYEKVRVSVTGFLKGTHYGVSLEAGDESLRLRPADEVVPKPRVCDNRLDGRIWALASELDLPGSPPRYEVFVEGFLRLLRDERGKRADSFSVFGQWPLEFIPLRVVDISPAKLP